MNSPPENDDKPFLGPARGRAAGPRALPLRPSVDVNGDFTEIFIGILEILLG